MATGDPHTFTQLVERVKRHVETKRCTSYHQYPMMERYAVHYELDCHYRHKAHWLTGAHIHQSAIDHTKGAGSSRSQKIFCRNDCVRSADLCGVLYRWNSALRPNCVRY